MTYRLSTGPDQPNLGEAWGYLTACGVSRDLAKSHAATFRLADALFRLIGPDPKRVAPALALLGLVEAADPLGMSVEIDASAGPGRTRFVSVGARQASGTDLAEICRGLTERLEEDES